MEKKNNSFKRLFLCSAHLSDFSLFLLLLFSVFVLKIEKNLYFIKSKIFFIYFFDQF